VVQVKSPGNGLKVRSRRRSRPCFGSIIAWWRFIPGSGIGWNLTGFIFLGRRFIIAVSQVGHVILAREIIVGAVGDILLPRTVFRKVVIKVFIAGKPIVVTRIIRHREIVPTTGFLASG
jgi:hypothetical protein